MDARAFTLGTLTGIAVTTFAFWALRSEPAPVLAAEPAEAARPQRSSATFEGNSEGTIATLAVRPAPAHGVEPARPPQNPASAVNPPVRKPEPTQSEPASWPPSREERDREPKDPGWSHYMEQTLGQYLAGHSRAAQFDFTSIDCRTTFCEIRAAPADESASPAWAQIMYDVRHQPWSDFGNSGSDEGTRDGRLMYRAVFERKPRGR
jgi:hypothetical protein